MEIKVNNPGRDAMVEIKAFDALEMAVAATNYFDKVLKGLNTLNLDDPVNLSLYNEHSRKLNKYNDAVYKLQLACGFDPNEL